MGTEDGGTEDGGQGAGLLGRLPLLGRPLILHWTQLNVTLDGGGASHQGGASLWGRSLVPGRSLVHVLRPGEKEVFS